MTTRPAPAALTPQQLDEYTAALTAYERHAPTGFDCCTAHPAADAARALLAEVHRLRAERDAVSEREHDLINERDELRGKFTEAAASLAEQVLRYRQRQRKHNADREELEQLRAALMGPCPVCIDADAVAAGGDGLVPYPCPTGRLAGAQDCDPSHVRAARPAV